MKREGDVPVSSDHLTPERVAFILARRHRLISPPPLDAAREAVEMLVWTLGDEHYATPLGDVWEAMAPVPVAALPDAPAGLIGLFSRRGVIHSLFDPAPLLQAPGAREHFLILRHARPRIALKVGTLVGIAHVPVDALPAEARLTTAAAAADAMPLTLVDTALLVDALLANTSRQEG